MFVISGPPVVFPSASAFEKVIDAIPGEQDVDQAFDYFEGMMKKFRERMKKLEDVPEKEHQL